MNDRSDDRPVFRKRNGSSVRVSDVYPVQLEHSVAHAAREASGAGDLEERSGERAAAEAI